MTLLIHCLAIVLCLVSADTGENLATRNYSATTTTPGSSVKKPASLGRVLFVCVVASKSHKNYFYGIVESLSRAGYEVTFLSPYQPQEVHDNVREVVLESNNLEEYASNTFKDGSSAHILKMLVEAPELCLKALGSEVYSQVLKEKYDIAFVSMFFNECFLGHINSWNIPFVFVSPMEMVILFSGLRIGNPSFPSMDYNPMLPFSSPKGFVERFMSVIHEVLVDARLAYLWYSVDAEARSRGLFPPNTPYLPSIYSNASLMIFNSFRMVEHPRPYMPNVLLAAGMRLKPPKPLPKELENWVQSAGHAGIIFFSLGSMVPASTIPLETLKVLVTVFKSLKQKVLWKFNLPDVGVELPPNVRLTTWAPQQDLLGHEKMRLFISHGGLSSMQESLYHGVPVLGLPVYGDQVRVFSTRFYVYLEILIGC
ncbi:UDP-glucuronosyl/UDP-glucosyltransferase [Trinorchestia longiramus]|nr:UDP-glucuronosyl/UDP-glucosyltransferase [Trinorchestia longiramus]